MTNGWSGALEDFDADVIFLGDSITAGGKWAEWFPEQSVCKLAVPGEGLEQVLYRADMVGQLSPEKVFILAGVNNISRRNYEETIENTYSQLLQELEALDCEVYVQSILPVREPSKVDNDRINMANEIIMELAMSMVIPGLIYIVHFLMKMEK